MGINYRLVKYNVRVRGVNEAGRLLFIQYLNNILRNIYTSQFYVIQELVIFFLV